MEENRYIVDRFEGDFVVIENYDTKEILDIEINKIPKNVKEGSCLIYKDDEYLLDINYQNNIENKIEEKIEDLWED